MTGHSDKDAHRSLPARFWIYQKERFPFLGHGLLIGAFSFCAIAYSRLSSGLERFISAEHFLICLLNTIGIFFLLRISDEHKDAEDDAAYRSELPVPRGLIALRELRLIGAVYFTVMIAVDLVFVPKIILPLILVLLWMALMGKEFFVPRWLKARSSVYVISHMLIIPFVDIFASSFDWYLEGRQAPIGLLVFFALSFMNGIVLEIGRKLRSPAQEKEGVLTYSAMLGPSKAVKLWAACLMATWAIGIFACWHAGFSRVCYLVLSINLMVSLAFGLRYLRLTGNREARRMEIVSGLWSILLYLTIGALPFILN